MDLKAIKAISDTHLTQPMLYDLKEYRKNVMSVPSEDLPELEKSIDASALAQFRFHKEKQPHNQHNFLVGSMLTMGGVLLGFGTSFCVQDLSSNGDTTSALAILSLTCMALGLAIIATATLIHLVQSCRNNRVCAKTDKMNEVSQSMKMVVRNSINRVTDAIRFEISPTD